MKKFSRTIFVFIGIILIVCATIVFYNSSLTNNKKGWYVEKESQIEATLQVVHPVDIYDIDETKINFNIEADKFEYTILSDGTISLNKYTGSNGVLVIPNKIEDREVSIVNFNGEFRKVVIPSTVKAITGNIELTDKVYESVITTLAIYIVTLLIYITVLISSTKKYDTKVSYLSLMYILIPIIYTLCTQKYTVLSSAYDYTFLALMLATTIGYLVIVAVMIGYTKEEKLEEKKTVKKTTAKKAAPKKTTATSTKKKTTTTKKTTTKKK